MDFATFFRALHQIDPFPWQLRLAEHVIAEGWTPGLVLDLPTGVGKTAALDIAVFHLVHQALDETRERTAPLRIFYVVDRRIVVDAAYYRARSIAAKLRQPDDADLQQAANALRKWSATDEPLHAAIMRGGMFRDDGWARSPAQATICVSTVDQVGSRLLFSGYGVSPEMRPIHAALVGSDSLFLVDEAHLSRPFLETLEAVRHYSGANWAETPVGWPIQVVRMSATTESEGTPFRLDEQDLANELLRRRLEASRPAVIEKPVPVDKDDRARADSQLAAKMAETAHELSRTLECEAPVVGVVLNRVRAARLVFEELRRKVATEEGPNADVILLTGRIRPFDRDELLLREEVQDGRGWLRLMEAGRKAVAQRPLFVVATQTIEVGADLDFDGLVTEAAALDALRQRFGRLNRLGDRPHARAVILIRSTDKAANADDPVYGKAQSRTWSWLDGIAKKEGKRKIVDFGLEAMNAALTAVEPAELLQMLTPREQAPVMLPAHVDLWYQTNPAPATVPDMAAFLHGPDSGPADVNVVWRADLLGKNETELKAGRCIQAVSRVPPTSQEACSVSLKEVRGWLRGAADADDMTDLEGGRSTEGDRRTNHEAGRRVLRWLGPKRSKLVSPSQIQPGDTIVVPCSYGGYDPHGWNRASETNRSPTDIAECCARWGRGRRVLRLDPGVVRAWTWTQPTEPDDDEQEPTLADRIKALQAGSEDREPAPFDLAPILHLIADDATLPAAISNTAADFLAVPSSYKIMSTSDGSWTLIGKERLTVDDILQEIAGLDALEQEVAESVEDESSADDDGAFIAADHVTLKDHTDGVGEVYDGLNEVLRLPPELDNDLRLAIRWHDLGKIDERFQKWLYGDEIAWSASHVFLAKSGIDSEDRAAMERARIAAGVPKGFRHEAFSVQLLDRFGDAVWSEAHDRDLVRFLIGTHHGHGRPFHPVVPDEQPPELPRGFAGLNIELSAEERAVFVPLHHLSANWPDLFWRLVRRYGYWGLAWLESLLRLADQQRSRDERERAAALSATAETEVRR